MFDVLKSPLKPLYAPFVILLLMGCLCSLAARDITQLEFKPLEVLSKAPSGEINSIIQGPDGFIWFATREGAHRYDGYGVKSYSSDKDDPGSIINSQSLVFHIDSLDRLWIGTQMGLSRYVPETDSFINYLLDKVDLNSNVGNRANALVSDSKGFLYTCSEKGFVFRFSEEENQFIRLNPSSFGKIKSMTVDEYDRLWIGSANEVYRFDPYTQESRRFSGLFGKPDLSSCNFINSILYVDETEIWLATEVRGALRFNSLTEEVVETERIYQKELFVQRIFQDKNENIWVCHNDGITIHVKESGKVHRYHKDDDLDSLQGSAIHSLLIDEQENIWVGSSVHGIYVSVNNKRFHRLEKFVPGMASNRKSVVASLMIDHEKNLWVGYFRGGVDLLHSDESDPVSFRNDPTDSSTIGSHTVFSIFEDSFNTVWIGSYQGGFHRYDRNTGGFKSYTHDSGDPDSIPGNDVRDYAEDEHGNFWLVTHGQGVAYFDRKTEKFRPFQYDPDNTENSLIDDWPFTVHYSKDRKLYVGTAVGLSIIDPKKWTSKNYATDPGDPDSLSNSVINCILEDSKDQIWLGTNDGLILFDPKTGHGKTYTVEDGMPNRVIASVLEDDQGYLWVGTYNGLARFEPESGQIKTYDVNDGLVHNEFSLRAAVKAVDGMLYFGQKNGITYFDPQEIKDNKYVPQVHLTDFKLFNKSVSVSSVISDDEVLASHILKTKSISLHYDQKIISFEFVALNYIQSRKNQYAYMLEGFEEGWNYLKERREVNYTNLSPGKYTFLVKGSNNDGYWNDSPRRLDIRILPPFWQTWWFRLSIGSLLVLIPALLFFLRLRQIHLQKERLEFTVSERTHELEEAYSQLELKQEQIQSQNKELHFHREELEAKVQIRTKELEFAKEKAEHSDRLKSAFLANMSHEIRTPMNAIMGFLEILGFSDIEESDRNHYTRLIMQSGETLLALIDDILDLSRIEANELVTIAEPTDIGEICYDLYQIYVRVLEQKKKSEVEIRYIPDPSIKSDTGGVILDVDPVRFKQVLTNLLSNAAKFTESGSIELQYRIAAEDGKIHFTVTDTGVGIPKEGINQIFDRFHKVHVDDDKLYGGTGLGLTISLRLAELMDGSISVESSPGIGSSFTLTLPYKKPSHPFDLSGNKSTSRRELAIDSSLNESFPDFTRYSILVAEDEAPNYEFIRQVFNGTGGRLVWAKDGEQAIQLFKEEHFDLLLLDLKMPRKDGYEVIREVREINKNIPIIIQSAFAMIEDREASIQAGANDFISKPFTVKQLCSSIAKLIGN